MGKRKNTKQQTTELPMSDPRDPVESPPQGLRAAFGAENGPYPPPPSAPPASTSDTIAAGGPAPNRPTFVEPRDTLPSLKQGVTPADTKLTIRHGLFGNKVPIQEMDKKVNPWTKRTEWNPVGIAIYTWFVAAYVFYFYVRIAHTLTGTILGYGITVLCFEFFASSAMFIHGMTLLRRTVPRDPLTPPAPQSYHIRVLIPCYTEALDIVKQVVLAAANAPLPDKCRRTVYLLDDGKDAQKADFVAKQERQDIVYVGNRIRQKGESNGKACNLNNTLRNLYPPGQPVDPNELLCIFDADMLPKPEFFMKMLAELNDPRVALVLSPQSFHNYNPKSDIFNHSNFTYWEYILPGLDGWDMISCTGTNFIIRADAGQMVDWFPTYTLGEDMALALALEKAGYCGAYVKEYLAVGEAPESVRNCFMQKSRWCKGGMQVWFSKHNPWLNKNLKLSHKILWSNGPWSYMTGTFATPIFLAIPVIGIWSGYFPIEFNIWFAIAFTVYMLTMYGMVYYCRSFSHLKFIWFSTVAGYIFWFTYMKATVNTFIGGIMGKNIKFKTTEKSSLAQGIQDQANKAKRKVEDSAFGQFWLKIQDIWIPAIVLIANLSAVVVGIVRLTYEINTLQVKTLSLFVSIGWCVYNSIPPYLLLHYWAWGHKGLCWTSTIASLVSTLVAIFIIIMIWLVLPNSYDFGKVLATQFKFYEAQRSGHLTNNDIPWRGDSGLGDVYGTTALHGGYYTDGGFVKYGMPLAFTTTMLSWSLLEFPKGYSKAGQTADAEAAIRWATDYLLECNVADGTFVGQVGTYASDAAYWGKPEVMTENRTAFVIDASNPGADLLGSTSAALAAASSVFQYSDPTYSATLLAASQTLFRQGRLYSGLYSNSIPDAATLYPSTSYLDDMALACMWLWQRTGVATLLSEAQTYLQQHEAQETTGGYGFSWDNQAPAAQLLLANATSFQDVNGVTGAAWGSQTGTYLLSWVDGSNGVTYNVNLLAYAGDGAGAYGVTANVGFLAMAYWRYSGKEGKLRCWALSQARHLLGDSGRSYVVGYGHNPPTHVTHKAASCPGTAIDTPCDASIAYNVSTPNPHVLTGALVSGPVTANGLYADQRTSLDNRVSIEYNAGFAGLLAALEQWPRSMTNCLQGRGLFNEKESKKRPV